MIHIIAAIQESDRGIGYQGNLLYHLPEDMKHFRNTTTGHIVIMGRKTWESIPEKFRPLPNRENIVITRQTDYVARGAKVVSSLDEALDSAHNHFPDKEIFIIGGGELYAQAITRADILHLTLIHDTQPADVFFPEFEHQFSCKEKRVGDSANPSLSFTVWKQC